MGKLVSEVIKIILICTHDNMRLVRWIRRLRAKRTRNKLVGLSAKNK